MTDCILWHGTVDGLGYGRTRRRDYAHRHVWAECFGPIPRDVHVHHDCETKLCVNPAHLRLVTPAEHVALHRPAASWYERLRALTHCKHGHELTPDNLVYRRASRGTRECRECNRLARRRYYYAQKERA